MSVTDKIDNFLNEASDWKPGMWVVQRRSGENEYALLVDKTKKGWLAVTIDDDRMVPAKKSITNAYPPFEPLKSTKEIDKKLLNKVEKKLNQLNIDLKV